MSVSVSVLERVRERERESVCNPEPSSQALAMITTLRELELSEEQMDRALVSPSPWTLNPEP